MNSDQSSLEAQLRELRATPLDEDLLFRLDAAADGSLVKLTPEEIRFEAFLRSTPPAALSVDFLDTLEAVVRDVPFETDEKIVPFPNARPAAAGHHRKRPMWAAAAAVALIGAASALLVPTGKEPSSIASRPVPQAPPPVANNASPHLVPAAFNRGVSEVRDEGVIWKSNNQPHNLVRVVYKDKTTLKDSNGRTYHVEQPRVEYMLVPAKTD
jgi:hypothetical protein